MHKISLSEQSEEVMTERFLARCMPKSFHQNDDQVGICTNVGDLPEETFHMSANNTRIFRMMKGEGPLFSTYILNQKVLI